MKKEEGKSKRKESLGEIGMRQKNEIQGRQDNTRAFLIRGSTPCGAVAVIAGGGAAPCSAPSAVLWLGCVPQPAVHGLAGRRYRRPENRLENAKIMQVAHFWSSFFRRGLHARVTSVDLRIGVPSHPNHQAYRRAAEHGDPSTSRGPDRRQPREASAQWPRTEVLHT